MEAKFDLLITADYSNRMAELRLLDGHGSQLAIQRTDFAIIPVSRLQGLFDLRNYLRHYVEPDREAEAVAEIGVCIAKEVLGDSIFKELWASKAQRSLRIQLPEAVDEDNFLVAALARVPWEIARPSIDAPETLADRNLLVRVVHDMAVTGLQPLDLDADESLRVLFVFAEARGSRLLAVRRERRELLQLFEREIYPHRHVVAHFLSHGVTRERLESQIQENDGYHVVHWSGHGHLNLLELAKPGGASDHLTGKELLELFVDAGGFIPRLFFISACHSGDILRVKDWNDFLAVAQGKESVANYLSESGGIPIDQPTGNTGTTHALLQGGVPSVVAMRYAVGDEYARELGVEFYRALLAHKQPKSAAAALTLARRALLDPAKHAPTRYVACDHAAPILYGEEQPGLNLRQGSSPARETPTRRLHQIAELTAASHEHFVGRTWELAGLGSDFIGSSDGAEITPVALVTGLGGMGKTALTAEALALWESRFEWVLLYQAKPNRLEFDATLRDIHMKLYGEVGRYYEHVQSHRADEIYRAADASFAGPARIERLTTNLIRAMRDEAILLVLDNFETNLKPHAESGSGESLWACQDPAWDHCLMRLATELDGTRSRVLVTCRHPIAALAGTASHHVRLGPLPVREAALYLREHSGLSEMVFGGDEGERALAMRLLTASRFHPLLMDRLARLATGGPTLRLQLEQALAALETHHDYSQLPESFTMKNGNAKELAYLKDALADSLDRLIADASADARRLLWTIAVANDPVALGLLKSVWSGEEVGERQQLWQIKAMLDRLPELPPELQEQLKAMPPELRALIDALPPEAPAAPDLAPLLGYLVAVGLVTEERTGPDDENPDLTCHELVRERVRTWMLDHREDRGEVTENTIRLAYAERLEAAFQALQHQHLAAAIEAGSRALVYYVQAEAHDRLGSFAGRVVTSTNDPVMLERLLTHLEAAAESAPEGQPRWSCLTYLADALRNAGRPDASLPHYEQAATLARAATELEGEAGRRAWSDVGWITGNWAAAFLHTGNLAAARDRQLESAEALRKAGDPAVNVVSSELGALRIDIMQGKAEQSLPEIEARLAQVEQWWTKHRSGQDVPEAPDPVFLARAFIVGLDVAMDAHFAQEDWEAALHRIDAILEVKRAVGRPAEDIAKDRVNRAVVLGNLGRYGEAQAELEQCLEIFQNDPIKRARTLSSLAGLFYNRGDITQAITQERRALAIRDQVPDPNERANSHHNLANHLKRSGTPSGLAESPHHQLAALVYFLVSGLHQGLQTTLRSYAVDYSQAHDAGTTLTVPRIAELLVDPAFQSLNAWLRQRGVDEAELQTATDQILRMAYDVVTTGKSV